LCNITLSSQNLKYYLQSTETTKFDREVLSPFDTKYTVEELNEAGWSHRGILLKEEIDKKELNMEMRIRLEKITSSLTLQEKEALRNVNVMMYLSKDFKLLIYSAGIDKKHFDSFVLIEKKLYDFMNEMTDMSFLKKYYILPYDFPGTIYRLRFKNYL